MAKKLQLTTEPSEPISLPEKPVLLLIADYIPTGIQIVCEISLDKENWAKVYPFSKENFTLLLPPNVWFRCYITLTKEKDIPAILILVNTDEQIPSGTKAGSTPSSKLPEQSVAKPMGLRRTTTGNNTGSGKDTPSKTYPPTVQHGGVRQKPQLPTGD